MLFSLLAPALAQAEGLVQSPAYQECTRLASTAPAQALAKADEWLKIDDSISAHHCRAMALFGLQRFADAADALEFVRDKVAPDELALQTYVTHQAAKAWVSAGKTNNALLTIGRQIEAMGKSRGDNATAAKLSAELLLDRAHIRVEYGQLTEAVRDLDRAISLTPLNSDALLARATVFQQLGDRSLATADAQAVLKLDPANEKAQTLLKKLDAKK